MEPPQDLPVPPPQAARTPGPADQQIAHLKRRLIREATMSIGMLETALDALWRLDVDTAREVTRYDDRIDREEVQIEQDCFRILTLQHHFAREFRVMTFILKVNNDIERVADHACSIAKIVRKIQPPAPSWPTALVELGERVPMMCHTLLRAVLDEDVEAARGLVATDKTIDNLDKQLFDEAVDLMARTPGDRAALANGLLIHRIGRELERIGDLMCNIAEDVVYLATGDIIRHAGKQRARASAGPG